MFRYLLIIIMIVLCAGCGSETDADSGPTLEPQAAAGQKLFQAQCATCHAVKGDRVIVGPSLQGVANRAGNRVDGLAASDYLHQSIISPNAYVVDGFAEGIMPQNFGRDLSSEQVDQLVAYLLTLN